MMILVNGHPDDRIVVSDRGFQYGDGVFETLAYRKGKLEFLDQHLARLQLGCQTLAIPFEQIDSLLEEIELVVASLENDAVIKVIVTRGSGGRGYRASSDICPTRIVSSHAYPEYPKSHYISGVTLRYCQHKLSQNQKLAGIKHLNRLDQVIARNEWSDESIHEGLMLDQDDHVIEGTMSNLFILLDGVVVTSPITSSGIKGVIRTEILATLERLSIPYNEKFISKNDVNNASEVFVSNSVIGIWPVTNIEQKMYLVGEVTQRLQTELGIAKA